MTDTKEDTGYGIINKGLGNENMVSDCKGDGTVIGTKRGTINQTRNDSIGGN